MGYLLMALVLIGVLVGGFVYIKKVVAPKSHEKAAKKKKSIEEIYKNNPREKKIEAILSDKFFYNMDSHVKQLQDTAAKIILTSKPEDRVIVITDKMYYQYFKGTVYKELMAKSPALSSNFKTTQIIEKSTYKKEKSVVGSAVVGGAIAGGVGAVVGAASAASANANGGKTTHVLSSNGYGLTWNMFWFMDCYLSQDTVKKFSKPAEATEEKNGFTYLDTYEHDKKYVESITTYLKQVTNTMYQNAK